MGAALIVIDMQNDFCLPAADLFVGDAPQAIPHIVEAVEGFRAAGVPVIWVLRRHRADGSDVDRSRRELFARRPFLVESPGADLVDGLAIRDNERVVYKTRWSAFFGTDLDPLLRRLGVTRLYLSGVQTPNCIRTTACDANALDYEVVVLSDATASANQAVQDANLFDMRKMGIEVRSAAEAVADVQPGSYINPVPSTDLPPASKDALLAALLEERSAYLRRISSIELAGEHPAMSEILAQHDAVVEQIRSAREATGNAHG
jgi:nicotinamidase-related amidase